MDNSLMITNNEVAMTAGPTPSFESLVRPEHILRLSCLPGSNKVTLFGTVTNLWSMIHSPFQTSEDSDHACEKLIRLSSLVETISTAFEAEYIAAVQQPDPAIERKVCGICLAETQSSWTKQDSAGICPRAPLSRSPIVLQCGNVFCHGCLTMWLKAHNHCPALSCEIGVGLTRAKCLDVDLQIDQRGSAMMTALQSL